LRRCYGFFDQQFGASATQPNQDQIRGHDHARQEEAVPQRHGPQVYEEIREQSGSKEKAARIANAAAGTRPVLGWKGCGKSGSYEDWTFDDLRKRVKELGLSGYSGKHKCELVSMLRNH
jgi:hypothetical protein